MHTFARGAAAMALGAIASLTLIDEAAAASSICRQLEAQLASGSRGSSRNEGVIARQRIELVKARGQLASCGLFSGSNRCDSLRSTIRRMERNMSTIKARSGGGVSQRSRGRILAALDANGCRGGSPQRLMVVRKVAPPSILSAFFGDDRQPVARRSREDRRVAAYADRPWLSRDDERRNRRNEYRNRDANERRRDAEEARRSVGAIYGASGLQAMCVRLSDGYYFPISPSSSRANFDRDRNNCQAMCPGAEISIYHRKLDEEDTENMVSAETGRRYRELPTANLSREQQNPGCSGDRQAALEARSEARTIDFEFPIPSPKPGSDNTIPMWVGAAEAAVPTLPPAERKVRVVGPAFLPDQPAASAPPVQDQTPVL